MAINEIPLPHVNETEQQRDKEILRSMVGHSQTGGTFAQDATAGPAGDGVLPSGTVVARDGDDKYIEYGGTSDEVVTLTEGGSGLTSFTVTFGGQTTGSLDDDVSAADLQTALEDLSTVGEGNVVVTGGPLATGPFTVEFTGDLADTNVGDITTTPTGGTGTVDVAVGTAGGTAPADDARGVLRHAVDVSEGDVLGNVVIGGDLKLDQLVGLDAAAVTALNGRTDTALNSFSF